MDDLMFAKNELMKTASQLGREIVVEKESQAARLVSNSTASRTSASDTSNQWLTVLMDRLVLTLRASTRAGTPECAALGWPKLRFGSTMIWRSLPSGYQTMSLPENSSSFRNGSTIRANSAWSLAKPINA